MIRLGRSAPGTGACQVASVVSRSYRFIVEGELGERFADAFDEMTLAHESGNTIFVGEVRDQAHLQGLLQRIASLGLTLLSVSASEKTRPTA